MDDIPLPERSEIERWMISTVRHSSSVEYFLSRLGVRGEFDLQRPHDISGPHNKLDWEILKRFALQYRNPEPEGIEDIVADARDMHRKQHHHRTWNWADENTPHEDMVVGAVDAVCSRMEDRAYQGGAMTYGEIRGFVKSGEFKGTDRQRHYIEMVMGEMKLLAQPEVGLIDSLHSFPNIGLPEPMYNRMVEKVGETVLILRERNYLI